MFSCSCTDTPKSREMCAPSLARFVIESCCGLLQVIAKVRPVSVHAVTRTACFASSLFCNQGPSSCQVLNSSTVPRVSLSFAPVSMFTTNSDNYLFFFLYIWRRLDSTDVPSSCNGVCDPWSVEYQSCKCAKLIVRKQRLASFQHLRKFSRDALS